MKIVNKLFYTFLILSLLFTSCTEDEDEPSTPSAADIEGDWQVSEADANFKSAAIEGVTFDWDQALVLLNTDPSFDEAALQAYADTLVDILFLDMPLSFADGVIQMGEGLDSQEGAYTFDGNTLSLTFEDDNGYTETIQVAISDLTSESANASFDMNLYAEDENGDDDPNNYITTTVTWALEKSNAN